MLRKSRGLLIVFEGLDRTGKTTQAKLLKKYFDPSCAAEEIKTAQLLRFPKRDSVTGRKIDEHLKNKGEYSDKTIHELFSQNRWECRDDMLAVLNQGVNIIVDRYAYSGVAYSVAKGLELEWCKKHDEGLPKPDIVFYLDMSEDGVSKREGFGNEIYERKDFQGKVHEAYEKLIKGDEWRRISGALGINEIHERVVNHIEEHMKKVGGEDGEVQPVKELW